jgi:predicted dehydrogenase
MGSLRCAIIGCGRTLRPDGQIRHGMAYAHAKAYAAYDGAEVAAVCDIREDAAHGFLADLDFQAEVFTDYRELLAQARPEVVSVCTWPALHAEMVIAAAESGARAIHCEKPMAPTWGECRKMVAVCQERGVQLSFNHQRRFGLPFRRARELVRAGAIGELRRIEGQTDNLSDWGTHWFDMFFFYNGDEPAEWVLGQIDKRTDRSVFKEPVDDQGMSWFGFANGVQAILLTGNKCRYGAGNRLIGTTGAIELEAEGVPGHTLRLRDEKSKGWKLIECGDGMHGDHHTTLAIADVLDCLKSGAEPELAARKALQSTEIIFATYESSRRRGRVDLPLTVDDSALKSMLADGVIGPGAAAK